MLFLWGFISLAVVHLIWKYVIDRSGIVNFSPGDKVYKFDLSSVF